MNKKLSKRKLVDITINDLIILVTSNSFTFSPSKIRIKTSRKKIGYDLGCLAFLKREKQREANGELSHGNCLVDKLSFRKYRVCALKNYIENLANAISIGQIKEITAEGKIRNFIIFIDWCDKNYCANALFNISHANLAYKSFSEYLESQILDRKLNVHTALIYQKDALQSLSWSFNTSEDQVQGGIYKIRHDESSVNKTNPPEMDAVNYVVSLCSHIFEGLFDLISKEREFPYSLKLPKESCWIFPARPWVATQEKLLKREEWKVGNWSWDYENGKINSAEAIRSKYPKASEFKRFSNINAAVKKAESTLALSNSEKRHSSRVNLAGWAHNTFLILFFANTGMNNSQALNLIWQENYNVDKSTAGFKCIKYRANNKEVNFFISRKFLITFRKYLKIREFLLNGKYSEYLFYPHIHDKNRSSALNIIYRDLRKTFYLDIPKITTRQWRSYKADFLVKNADIATTAALLQNNESTVIRSYTEGSEAVYEEEITDFFYALDKKVRVVSGTEMLVSSPSGHCSKPNQPKPNMSQAPIQPDCITPEGCFFCENYAIHADAQDLRKLYSIKYLLNETKHLAFSLEHFEKIFGEVIRRIDSIIKHLESISPSLAQLSFDIHNDVYEKENLDRYWESKLSMLYQIGAL